MKSQETKFVIRRQDGKRIVGLIAGLESEKQKPALILLHGFTGSKDQKHIAYPARKAAEAGFVTVRFDGTDGLGESDGDVFDCDTGDYLEDLNIVYNYVKRLKFIDSNRIHLFGTSWGGMIAYHFKNKNELESIILHEPTFRWQTENAKKNLPKWKENGYYLKYSRSKNIDVKIGYNYYLEGCHYNNP